MSDLSSIMPYLIVRDTDSGSLVDGLPCKEIRIIAFKTGSEADVRDEKNRRVEFSTDPGSLLNALETIGYRVVTCANFGSSDFIWTLCRQ